MKKDYDTQRRALHHAGDAHDRAARFPERRTPRRPALDSIQAGATFDPVVTAQGKTAADTLLGTFAKDKVPDPAVAEAAFALQANEVSPVDRRRVRSGAGARDRDHASRW